MATHEMILWLETTKMALRLGFQPTQPIPITKPT